MGKLIYMDTHNPMARFGNTNRRQERIGEVFGHLTVIGRVPSPRSGEMNYLCRCVCGKEVIKTRALVNRRRAYTNWSCGCKNRKREPAPATAPVKHPTLNQLYWAAGIFEGEGNSQGWYTGNTVLTSATVCQKDPWILLRLQELFGGRIKKRGANRFSTTPDGKKHLRDVSDWQLYGTRARGFLMTIYPLLSPRRQEQLRRALGVQGGLALKHAETS